MNAASSIFFLIILGVSLSFAILIVETSYADHISTLSFFYETQFNDTTTNTSGACMNVTLERISEQYDAQLNLTYVGGNASDLVYVNGNYVGNLSPASPDSLTVNPTFLDVDTCIDFTFAGAAGSTNITNATLEYYRYDGCNYGETACVALDSIRDMDGAVFYVLVFAPILLGVLILIGLVRSVL